MTEFIKTQKNKFISGAIILSIGAFLSKFLGAFYRFPLTNIITSNGMGIYQLIYPLYSLLLVLSSSGIPVALGKLIAENIELGRINYVRKLEKSTFIIVLIIGLVFSAIIMLLSSQIAILQGNISCKLGYLALAPSILLVSAISVIRGIFQGRQNMLPTALSQIVEQVVKIILGLVLSAYFLQYGVQYAVMGALLAVTLSEVAALIFLIIVKRISITKKQVATRIDNEVVSSKEVVCTLFKIALPITICAAVLPISLFIDSAIIVNLLKAGNMSVDSATSLYGIFAGVVMTLINLPVVISTSLSVSLVPNLSVAVASKDTKKQNKICLIARDVVLWVTLPCCAFFALFPNQIISLLFNESIGDSILVAGNLLLYVSPVVILLSLIQIFSSVLQCYKKVVLPAINLIIGVGIKTAIIVMLMLFTNLGIYSVVIGYLVGYLFALIFDYISLNKLIKLPIFKESVAILLSVLNVCLIMVILQTISQVSFLFSAVICVFVYVIHIYMFKGLLFFKV